MSGKDGVHGCVLSFALERAELNRDCSVLRFGSCVRLTKSGACYSVLRRRLKFLRTYQSFTGPRKSMMIIAGVVQSAGTHRLFLFSHINALGNRSSILKECIMIHLLLNRNDQVLELKFFTLPSQDNQTCCKQLLSNCRLPELPAKL